MKAIILAAGMGTRLGKYTNNLPKGMLPFNGKTLLEWQVQQLKGVGVNDIYVVTGYKREKINYAGLTYFHNAKYETTNMVESLMCAREILDSEVLISYSDIIFSEDLAAKVSNYSGDIGVAVDQSWREYWMQRYGSTETDLESLTIKDNNILELGRPVVSSSEIEFRYIGMVKFSANGIQQALEVYDRKRAVSEPWIQSGNYFEKGYMTDLLNEIIIAGVPVEPIISDRGWLEFDTVQDYEVTLKLLKNNKINNIIS